MSTSEPPLPDAPAAHIEVRDDGQGPIALVFPSRSGGVGHVVIAIDFEPKQLACTCPAMRNLAARPQGCWAMVRAREIMGMEEI